MTKKVFKKILGLVIFCVLSILLLVQSRKTLAHQSFTRFSQICIHNISRNNTFYHELPKHLFYDSNSSEHKIFRGSINLSSTNKAHIITSIFEIREAMNFKEIDYICPSHIFFVILRDTILLYSLIVKINWFVWLSQSI